MCTFLKTNVWQYLVFFGCEVQNLRNTLEKNKEQNYHEKGMASIVVNSLEKLDANLNRASPGHNLVRSMLRLQKVLRCYF